MNQSGISASVTQRGGDDLYVCAGETVYGLFAGVLEKRQMGPAF